MTVRPRSTAIKSTRRQKSSERNKTLTTSSAKASDLNKNNNNSHQKIGTQSSKTNSANATQSHQIEKDNIHCRAHKIVNDTTISTTDASKQRNVAIGYLTNNNTSSNSMNSEQSRLLNTNTVDTLNTSFGTTTNQNNNVSTRSEFVKSSKKINTKSSNIAIDDGKEKEMEQQHLVQTLCQCINDLENA